MKKVLVLAVFVVFGLTTVSAQDGVDKVIDQAKNGGFKIGANIGLPLSTTSDLTSFNTGGDIAYLFEVIDNFEVGGLVGYAHFFGDGTFRDDIDDIIIIRDFKDAAFVIISSSGRYYFGDDRFFGGIDLGFAINVSGDDGVDNGLYYRPKFGFNFGVVSLIASFQGISGGVTYNNSNPTNVLKVSGFNSFNVGVELAL